jgi:hypothetical protein
MSLQPPGVGSAPPDPGSTRHIYDDTPQKLLDE